jgi:nucleotide-binding universal stress UspA family protein
MTERRRRHTHFPRILIGYDGSPEADKAVAVAFSLAQDTDSTVLILSVARPPEPPTSVELEAMLDDAREHFEEKFTIFRERAAALGLDVKTDVVVGHPVEQIVHRGESDNVDLIIMGRRGMSRFGRMIVGSTSEKVLRYAHCPVMVVR